MDEPPTIHPQGPGDEPPGWPAPPQPREVAQRSLLRRLLALLVAGGTAFTLTTWVLVRYDNPLGILRPAPGPAKVVQAHLEALSRGEVRTAYEMFSQQYREKVSFEAYQELVVRHRRMFSLREFEFSREEESGVNASLETRIVAMDGARYVARFTLVRAEGRWWIDGVHWGADAGRSRVAV